LVPRLGDHLRRIDLSQQWTEMSANAILAALAALGDPAAVGALVDTLGTAVRHEHHGVTQAALKALAAFGPAATGALDTIRSLTTVTDAHVRPAAVAALWAVGGDLGEVMPLLLGLLDDPITFRISDAADLLGEIGPPASVALPRLRRLLTHDYEWVRVPCAAALWEIGGQAEAPAVLDTLLQAWAKNPATANRVVACLDRMGPLAAPALPLLREQLALPRRGGRFESIDHDEELQRVGRTLIARLDPPAPSALAL
jgi:HEAT repeat protein